VEIAAATCAEMLLLKTNQVILGLVVVEPKGPNFLRNEQGIFWRMIGNAFGALCDMTGCCGRSTYIIRPVRKALTKPVPLASVVKPDPEHLAETFAPYHAATRHG